MSEHRNDLAGTLEAITDKPVSRRKFLGGALGGALVLAVPLAAAQRAVAAGTGGAVGAYIIVGADETITIVCPNSEMGQGTSSALPQILADELMVDWTNVRMRLADADAAFNNPMFGSQGTGGSTAVRAYYDPLRKAGAQAREMLVAAAIADTTIAGLGGGQRSDYSVAKGIVTNAVTKATGTYGQLAAAAGKLTPPANPELLGTGGLIGQPVARKDIPAKVNGSAVFGIDVRVTGMLNAAIRLAPKVGQTLGTVGKPPTGYAVVQLKDPAGSGKYVGVAAVATSTSATTWDVIKVVRALSVSWVDAPHTSSTDTAAMKTSAQNLMTTGTPRVAKSSGDPKGAIAAATKQLDATYSVPYLAHATMEPMNATAQVLAGKSCEIWAPTQNQTGSVGVAKALTGLTDAQVKLHTTFLGGGLGRRYETDFVHYAVQTAMATAVVGKPVKLTWPREEDFTHDVYRPSSLCRFTGGLDASNQPVGITSRSVSQSIFAGRGWLWPPDTAVDSSAVEGLIMDGGDDTVAYTLGSSQLVEWVNDTTAKVPLGFWRSVGQSYNTFFLESFLDEMAIAAGADPLAFRKSLLKAGSRELAVLQTLESASGWATAPKSGVARGVALSRGFGGTIVGHVAEVSGSLTSISIGRVTTVVDCGTVINPDTVKAQMESAILQGIAAAMWQDMPFTLGTPARKNFSTYRMGKMREAPVIGVTIMPANGNPPGGVGEPGVPAVAPAVGNAIAKLTGTRLRSLPFFPQVVPVV